MIAYNPTKHDYREACWVNLDEEQLVSITRSSWDELLISMRIDRNKNSQGLQNLQSRHKEACVCKVQQIGNIRNPKGAAAPRLGLSTPVRRKDETNSPRAG